MELTIPCSTLGMRMVDVSESILWPGSYLTHPVAFVLPGGPHAGQWAYGVTRYEVNTDGLWLTIISGNEVTSVKLLEPLRVMKADPITYALQVGATLSDMLLSRQDAVIAACRKRRSDLPTAVNSLLSVPFAPEELIQLVRPHDLGLVTIRRQHVLDCQMGARKKSNLNIYQDPQTEGVPNSGVQTDQYSTSRILTNGDMLSVSDVDNIQEVQLMNRTL
ncbi:hypothetical protein PHMEG_00012810 [Phytophthora megakarya]|uniref:Uncharacterized protein n=1 Tax=Phytophthora megakarya TaxID=4795 RepID=A0A225W8T5_9STRA|nr:hypothetical protein PHMEG_00012810 [Phytophthora megakarya]